MHDDDEYCLASDAIAFLSAHGVQRPESRIMDALRVGDLAARGYFTHRIEGTRSSEWAKLIDRIPVQFWQTRVIIARTFFEPESNMDDDWTDNWPDSYFSNTRNVPNEFTAPTKYFQSAENVSFAYRDLERLFLSPGAQGPKPSGALASLETGERAPPNIGGKPASKHGDVLGAATLRLANLPAAELNRYTTDSLAAELAEAYLSLGEAPPSDRNCQKYAAGILRVVRARET